MENKPEIINFNGWSIKIRRPLDQDPKGVILMLHGWTGDENSMWIFGDQFPRDHLLISPRGLNPSDHPKYGGQSWVEKKSGKWPWLDDFMPAVNELSNLLENLKSEILMPSGKIKLVGFSQGAALTYSFTLLHPAKVKCAAGLAGFAPERVGEMASNRELEGLPIFISHGLKDEIVPVEKAQESKRLFEDAGAKVTYCESNGGHKLGASCFRNLKDFISQ